MGLSKQPPSTPISVDPITVPLPDVSATQPALCASLRTGQRHFLFSNRDHNTAVTTQAVSVDSEREGQHMASSGYEGNINVSIGWDVGLVGKEDKPRTGHHSYRPLC